MKGLIKKVSEKLERINELREQHEKHLQQKKKKRFRIGAAKKQEGRPDQIVEVRISMNTIFKVMLGIALFWLLGELIIEIKSILVMTLIAFMLALGLTPIVENLERYRIPRPVAILILYIFFLGGLALIFIKVLPIVAEQLFGIAVDIKNLFRDQELSIPWLENVIGFKFDSGQLQDLLAEGLVTFSQNLKSIAGSTFGLVSGIFQGLFSLSFTLILLFFILLEREHIGHFFLALFPASEREYILTKSHSVQQKMAKWFRGQLILMVSIGLGMYFGMKVFELVFGMKYAATIAIFAGLMELFPYIGVFLTNVLVAVIALNISPLALIVALGWMALIQFLEGNFLVPIVMEKTTGLSSVVVLIVLAVGAAIGNALGGIALGIVGMIFSVPVAASVAIFVQEYIERAKPGGEE